MAYTDSENEKTEAPTVDHTGDKHQEQSGNRKSSGVETTGWDISEQSFSDGGSKIVYAFSSGRPLWKCYNGDNELQAIKPRPLPPDNNSSQSIANDQGAINGVMPKSVLIGVHDSSICIGVIWSNSPLFKEN